MQETWQAFLEQEGATIQTMMYQLLMIQTSILSETPLVRPLSGFAMLAVGGSDRHVFLHGQFINDLNLIEEPAAQISAWCNPKAS